MPNSAILLIWMVSILVELLQATTEQ